MGTYREFLLSEKGSPSSSSLTTYLNAIQPEDWGAELKAAAEDADFQLRKATASLGNRWGGELFIGVRESDRFLVGTRLTKETFYDRLRQAVVPGDWFSVDLTSLLTSLIEVPRPDPDRRILVGEIRKGLLPSFVVDDDGDLVWFRREGRSDRRLTGYQGVEARREYARGRLLLELFWEFDATVRTIPFTPYVGAPVGRAYFSLPRYEGSRADGSFYSELATDDLEFLFASRPQGGTGFSAHGLLPRFLANGERLDRAVVRWNADTSRDWEVAVGNYIRSAREDAIRESHEFRRYLERLGLLPKS
ncbi:MAG: hypothetical protein L3K19_04745 [Thermoplasmata archaeon]|nr:hypothetical protein [Thermoplasmata archaeon]